MKSTFLFLMCLFLSTTHSLAAQKAASIKLLRGEVEILTLGKTTKLNDKDWRKTGAVVWVETGAIIKTAEKSFVKLIFIDKSQMNVGPNSEMKIEKYSTKDAGVIDLVKGEIRSKVTKDYLQIQDVNKSKLFIKTKNAVMGVRGTDFLIATNGKNTQTVLFEGQILFNRLENRGEVPSRSLEEVVDRGVRMFPGEFSVMEAQRSMPTVPSLLDVRQREQLEKNEDFNSDRTPSNASTKSSNSVVPTGLSGQVVSNSAETLKSEVAQISAVDPSSKKNEASSANPDGFVKGDMIKPANGSLLHLESGVIIPPGAKAVFDPHTNTYIAGRDSGEVASDGSYIPPKNVEITKDGKILVATTDRKGTTTINEVAPSSPVINGADSGSETTTPKSNSPTLDNFDNRFTPSGGLSGVNDPQRSAILPPPTRIIVNPN
jgi:hypothetical protein